jgi:hypothetical protein
VVPNSLRSNRKHTFKRLCQRKLYALNVWVVPRGNFELAHFSNEARSFSAVLHGRKNAILATGRLYSSNKKNNSGWKLGNSILLKKYQPIMIVDHFTRSHMYRLSLSLLPRNRNLLPQHTARSERNQPHTTTTLIIHSLIVQ